VTETKEVTIELTVPALMEHFTITHRQAASLLRWVSAKQTRELVKNDESAEAFSQAQHDLKHDDVFPEHDERLEMIHAVQELFF